MIDAPPGPDVGWWRVMAWLSGAGFALAALFAAVPALDFWAARPFYEPGVGFPLRDDPLAVGLRAAYRWVFTAACVATAAGLVHRLAARCGTRVPARLWAFPALLFILGPGLLVNGQLKEHWGRARPAEVAEFGGALTFSGPFVISDQCEGNCSFVSGEGSSAAALAFALVGLFWGQLGPVGRGAGGAALVVWLAGASWIRMAPGRHFLSDTLFAYLLMGLVAAALYRILGVGRLRAGAAPRDYGADLALGARRVAASGASGLRRLCGRPRP